MSDKHIITFLSDFGTQDGYAGSVKGVIKSIYPRSEIIDITHEIKPFDIRSAAFTLLNYYRQYPGGTVHLAVVDPGVGGERKPVIVRTAHYYFVGPDNGIFQYLLAREAYTLYAINAEKLPPSPESFTFHARDIFGPTAALLAGGTHPEDIGQRIDNTTQIISGIRHKSDSLYEVDCISVDRFGNIISAFSRIDMERLKGQSVKNIRVKNRTLPSLKKYYSQVKKGELLALWNSQDFLEVAVCQGSAVDKLDFDAQKDHLEIELEKAKA
ncbi:MAG TPA: hypothetical protein EYP36_11910 [Calditrichaeota bacterium]|nr:hypothetical protein [Calditrichota bacterium]